MVEMVKDIVIKKTDEIKPYWRNPRRNEATVSALMEIIPKVGFNVPILIDSDNVIVKGHARYAACVRLGIQEIPCIVSKNTEEQNKLDRLADNKISELAEWDTSELRYELEQLSVDIDLKTIGFELDFDNFMEKNYAQTELKDVTESSFQKDKENFIDDYINKDTRSATVQEHSDDFQETTLENSKGIAVLNQVSDNHDSRKFIKMKCPKCNEEIVITI